jgi:hypothetical protein
MLTIRRRSAGALLPTLAAVVLALAAAPVAHGAKTFQVVVLGDSFASGEGAPAVDGDYGADGAAIGNLRSDRPNANPLADWNGGSADIALTGDGASDARRCHRSPKATAPLAVRRLQDRFPDIAFTFRSFACSGARIEEGAFGSFEGAEPIDQNDRVPGQISQANSYLNALPAGHAKRIDALVMNIGGNNLGFSNLIERCENIGPSFPLNPCNPRSFGGLGNDDALRVFEQGQGTAESPDVIGLDDLPGFYRQLDRKIDRVSGTSGRLAVKPAKVYLTGPPNPLAGSNGCTTLTGANDYEKNLQASEIAWLQQDILPRMISAMRAAATADGNDWEFLDMSPHAPNGMCSGSNRMFNRNRDALRTQGATIFSDFNVAVSHGIAHPNRAGYAAMAPILADRLSPQVIDAFTPSAPPSAELAPLQTLAPRVQLRLPDPPEDFPSRPAVRQGITTLAGPLGEGIGTVEVPVTAPAGTDSISLEARRCGPLSPGAPLPQGCSAIHTVRGVLVGTPGVPTGVTAATHVAGVDVDWAKGSPASRTLRRFVVRAENFDDRVQLGFSFGADLRTALLPLEAGRWTVDVLECTDRGCGNPSSAADVESNGPVQIGDIRDFTDLQIQQPVGVFTTPAGRRVRAGGKFPLEISWATWSHWRDLSDVRLRLVGERGELGTIRIKMASGRVTVAGPDSRIRRGRIGRRGTLAARRFALRTARATIVGGGDRSRLVELELPLTLSKRLLPQRVDVDIAAAGRGKQQAFGPAGSFQVR